MRIAVLHPGEMGAAVAASLSPDVRAGWCAAGRSEATRRRADEAGLEELADLAGVAAWAGTVISVCPPAAAADVADAVFDAGFAGLYLDANAVAPTTVERIRRAGASAGADVVDGGIVGPAPRRAGTTRLYLAGRRAPEVAAWFEDGPLEPAVLSGPLGAASALKAAYAGWTKASAALLTGVRAYARAAGVEEALLGEWDRSQPGLRERSEAAWTRRLATAWRYEGEMREIAATMDEHGLPADFHDGAAAVYRRLAALAEGGPDLATALDELPDG